MPEEQSIPSSRRLSQFFRYIERKVTDCLRRRLLRTAENRNNLATLANHCNIRNHSENLVADVNKMDDHNAQKMGAGETNYKPPSVESVDEDRTSSSVTPTYRHQATQTGPANEDMGDVQGGSCQAITTQPAANDDGSLLSATTFCDKATQTRIAPEPTRCILKKTTSPKASTNTVAFRETLAADIMTGKPLLPNPSPGAIFRAGGHEHSENCHCKERNAAKRWRAMARRLARDVIAEAEARRTGGQRRVLWRRGMLTFLRKNGLNGNLERIGRHREHNDAEVDEKEGEAANVNSNIAPDGDNSHHDRMES